MTSYCSENPKNCYYQDNNSYEDQYIEYSNGTTDKYEGNLEEENWNGENGEEMDYRENFSQEADVEEDFGQKLEVDDEERLGDGSRDWAEETEIDNGDYDVLETADQEYQAEF